MQRLLLTVAIAFCGVVVGACGGKDKVVKVIKPKKEKDAKAFLADAREAAQNGNLVDADKAYVKSYEISKEFDTLEEHVDFLIHNGKPTKAQEIAKAYYDANLTSTRGYKLYADALIAGNKGEEALKVSEEIISANTGDAAGYEKRGRALLILERNDEGVESLRKAVQLDQEKSADYLLQLGIGLDKIKKGDEAALKFRAALKRKPDDPMILTYLGMALRNQGELDESKRNLEKAIELDPQNGRTYFELGLLFNVQQNQGDAQQALEKAVQKSPNESKFWYALGEIYRLQEQFDKAIKAYKNATDLDPPFPKATGKLGLLYVDAKRYDDAEALLIPAIRREPKNAIHYLYLGVVYAAKNQKKSAIDNYQRFLDLAPKNDPDIRRARAAIAELKRR
jgi:tetratricopeptide (TPR) repeat protein